MNNKNNENLSNDKNTDFNINDDFLTEELNIDSNNDLKAENNENNENNENINIDKQINNRKNNKKIFLLTIPVALIGGVASVNLFNQSEVQKEVTLNKKELNFKIEDNGEVRNRTAKEMREFYTPEGEEFIKALYPDIKDSDFALLNIGKTIEKELLNIEFLTTTNEVVKLKDLKGKRVILDFALTTCPSCKEELTYMSNRKDDKDSNDVFLHIFPRSTTEDIKNTIKELNIDLDMSKVVSSTGMNNLTFEDFSITHVPAKLFINENGVVTYVTTNSILDEELYNLHYERAFENKQQVLDFLK